MCIRDSPRPPRPQGTADEMGLSPECDDDAPMPFPSRPLPTPGHPLPQDDMDECLTPTDTPT
eukprot:6791020-Prorocentrum_lima.AAC.1